MKSFVPVAGVDVSKRFSDLCVLSPDNNVLLRQKIYHDMVSMKLAEKKLHEIELEYGTRPVVVMESTSHYHLILFQCFTNAGFEVVVVNPIQSSLRHTSALTRARDNLVHSRVTRTSCPSVGRRRFVPCCTWRRWTAFHETETEHTETVSWLNTTGGSALRNRASWHV